MKIISLNRNDISLNKRELNELQHISSLSSNLSFNPLKLKNKSNLFYPFVKINKSQKLVKHLLFWTVTSIILLYFLSLVKPFDEAILRTGTNTFSFIILFYLSRFLILEYYETKQYKKWIILSILTTTFLALARTIVEVELIGTTLFSEKPFLVLSSKLKFAQFVFYLVIGHIFFLFFTVYNISKIKSTLEQRLAKYKLQHTELKLRLLNAQLDPHFLFNTLNCIYAISILDSKKTPDLILKLSDILRFITLNSQMKRIPFTLEVEQTKNYLELFRLKNDKPINVYTEIDENLSNVHLIPMTLLTLVENAVKYGNLANESIESFVSIKIKKKNGAIFITVINSYNRNISFEKSTGSGNTTLRERLELEYSGKYEFTITEAKSHYTAELKIVLDE